MYLGVSEGWLLGVLSANPVNPSNSTNPALDPYCSQRFVLHLNLCRRVLANPQTPFQALSILQSSGYF